MRFGTRWRWVAQCSTSPARSSMRRTPARSLASAPVTPMRNACPSRVARTSNCYLMANMTASTTRCFASRPERLLRWLLCALTAMLACAVQADEGVIRSAEIVPGDGGYVLNADIDLELNPRLVDAISRGVSLYFTTELVIERPRWYWLNATVVERSLDYRLSY